MTEKTQITEPYPGVPASLTSKMESCVTDVMAQGHDKDSAIAICMTSVVEGKPLEEAIAAFEKHKKKVKAKEAQKMGDTEIKLEEHEEAIAYAPLVPGGVYSFDGLDKWQVGKKMIDSVTLVSQEFQSIVSNILWASSEEVPDKPAALQSLVYEFAEVLDAASGMADMAEAATIKAQVQAAARALNALLENKELPKAIRSQVKGLREVFKRKWKDLEDETHNEEGVKLGESFSGLEVVLAEQKPESNALEMNVVLLKPGFGNTHDNHYYSKELLKNDASKFIGAKMYETDHKQGEKSTRTWVSTITEINGFTSEGAPIAKVVVHHPDFAQRLVNLNSKHLLDKMECSILASATAERDLFELDGRKGKKIAQITSVESVDWVTRAGAGGHALDIAESDTNSNPQGGTENNMGETTSSTNSTVVITSIGDPVAEVTPQTATVTEPQKLSEAEVTTLLKGETRLPEASREHLAESAYSDSEAVKNAITKELAYLAKLNGSGQPFAMGATQEKPKRTAGEIAESVNAALDKVNQKYLHNKGG